MKAVGIIRERGQLTIPDSIRKNASWIRTSSVVSISLENPGELVVKPHRLINEIDWDNLLERIRKSREIKGRGNTSAAEFIVKDREIQ